MDIAPRATPILIELRLAADLRPGDVFTDSVRAGSVEDDPFRGAPRVVSVRPDSRRPAATRVCTDDGTTTYRPGVAVLVRVGGAS